MDSETIAQQVDIKIVESMTYQQLMDAHAADREAMQIHRARMGLFHEEITKREHAEARGKMNLDVTLDQGVRI